MKFVNSKKREKLVITPSEEELKQMFTECNHLYFHDELEEIPVEIMDSNDNYGEFRYTLSEKESMFKDMKICINVSKPRIKSEYIGTMVHEMLHYKVIKDISKTTIKKSLWYKKDGDLEKYNSLLYLEGYSHKGKWKEMAEDINRIYHLNIHLR